MNETTETVEKNTTTTEDPNNTTTITEQNENNTQPNYQEELDKLRSENQRLKQYEEWHTNNVIIDETGRRRLKDDDVSTSKNEEVDEEIKKQQMIAEQASNHAAVLIETSERAKNEVAKRYQDNPLYDTILQDAIKSMEKVPIQNRNVGLWEIAMNHSAAKRIKELEKIYKERGRQEALLELKKASNGALPISTKGQPVDDEQNYKNIQLSDDQLKAAHRMIKAGFINSIDEYKKNL